MDKVGIALSGGGARGSFQVGVLDYLYNVQNIRPDVICGASVGALNSAKLAEGPKNSADAFKALKSIWLGIKGNSDVFEDNPQLKAGVRDMISFLTSKVGEAAVVGAAGDIVTGLLTIGLGASLGPLGVAVGLIGGTAGAELADAQLLANIEREIIPQIKKDFGAVTSAFSLAPLQRLVNGSALDRGIPGHLPNVPADLKNLDPARVASSGIQLRIATVDLVSGQLLLVDEKGNVAPDPRSASSRALLLENARRLKSNLKPELQTRLAAILKNSSLTPSGLSSRLEGLANLIAAPSRIDLRAAIVASSAIPVFFEPVPRSTPFGKQLLVDGGVRQIFPVQPALDLGATRVFGVSASSLAVSSGIPSQQLLGIDFQALGIGERTIDLLTNELTLKESFSNDPRVTTISPNINLQDVLDFGPGIIRVNMLYGFQTAGHRLDPDHVPAPNDEQFIVLAVLAHLLDALHFLSPLQGALGLGARLEELRRIADDYRKALIDHGFPKIEGVTA